MANGATGGGDGKHYVFAEIEGAPGLELPPEMRTAGEGGRWIEAVDANDKLHEVFGGVPSSVLPDEEDGSGDGDGDSDKGSSSSRAGDDDDVDTGGDTGGGALGGESSGGGVSSSSARELQLSTQKRRAHEVGGGGHDVGGGGSKKKARAPRRENSQRKPAPAETAMALLEREVAASQAAREQQREFQEHVLRALRAGPAAVPLHTWAETLEDEVLDWLVNQGLLNVRFNTDGCVARALTREERDTNGITCKVLKRLLEYGVVLEE